MNISIESQNNQFVLTPIYDNNCQPITLIQFPKPNNSSSCLTVMNSMAKQWGQTNSLLLIIKGWCLSGGRAREVDEKGDVGFLTFSGWRNGGQKASECDVRRPRRNEKKWYFFESAHRQGWAPPPSWHTQYLSISSLINHSTKYFSSYISTARFFLCFFLQPSHSAFHSNLKRIKTHFDLLFGHINFNRHKTNKRRWSGRWRKPSRVGVRANCLFVVPLSTIISKRRRDWVENLLAGCSRRRRPQAMVLKKYCNESNVLLLLQACLELKLMDFWFD